MSKNTKNNNAIVTTNATNNVVTTNTNTNASTFVATRANASHMNDAMIAHVNANVDANERRNVVALYATLQSTRDTINDNDAKSIRRELRKRNFRISMFTRVASSNVIANAIASYDTSMKRV